MFCLSAINWYFLIIFRKKIVRLVTISQNNVELQKKTQLEVIIIINSFYRFVTFYNAHTKLGLVWSSNFGVITKIIIIRGHGLF